MDGQLAQHCSGIFSSVSALYRTRSCSHCWSSLSTLHDLLDDGLGSTHSSQEVLNDHPTGDISVVRPRLVSICGSHSAQGDSDLVKGQPSRSAKLALDRLCIIVALIDKAHPNDYPGARRIAGRSEEFLVQEQTGVFLLDTCSGRGARG
jgi:hypothetical protein